jgi:hypothetical protein
MIQIVIVLALVVLIVLTVIAFAQYSGKSNELGESSDKLENAIAETLSIVSTFATRVLSQMKRLLSSIKQWFLNWVEAFSKESAMLLEYFAQGITWWVSNITIQIQRIQTFGLQLANQVQRILTDLFFQISSKGATLMARLMSEMIIRTISGVLWITNKIFCTFVGIGRSLASFFTNTVVEQLGIFYRNFIDPYIFQPFLTAWNFIKSEAFWDPIETFFTGAFYDNIVKPIGEFLDNIF